MEFDWARLPKNVLFGIALKLESVGQLVVFSAVCSSWRDVYAKVKYIWTPKMPWIILSETKIDVLYPKKRKELYNHLHLRYVFDPNVDMVYQLRLPRTFGRRCWGCENGWICTLGIDMDFDLINPLTNNHLNLPFAETLPFVKPGEVCSYEFTQIFRRKYIKRVNLFTIPLNNELVFTVVYTLDQSRNWVAFAKPGDSTWKLLGHVKLHDVLDVASFEGHIMVLHKDGMLTVLDMDVFQHPEHKAFKDVEYVPTSKKKFKSRTYLTESFGKLLSIERVNVREEDEDEEYDDVVGDDDNDDDVVDVDDDDNDDDDREEEEEDGDDDEEEEEEEDYDSIDDCVDESYRAISYETQAINVHMFDFEAREWMAVDDLGDVALFVGNNSTMSLHASLHASEGVNCRRNCIYFTDDKPHDHIIRYLGQDMGIYDLKKRRFTGKLYDGDYVLSKFCPPFWYMPKFV